MKIVVLALVLFCSQVLMAEEAADAKTNGDLTRYYDAELFQWSYGMFTGLTLNFQNQSAMTVYGIKDPMKNALRQYEDSRKKYNAYQRKTVVGNILLWGGLAAIIGGIYLPSFAVTEQNDRVYHDYPDTASYERLLTISIGLVLGGFVSEMIGGLVLQSGQASIFDAVHSYNRQKIGDYR
jgi:hypothetical protein